MQIHTLAAAFLLPSSLAFAQTVRELAFQPNVGQAPAAVEFVARGREYALSLSRERVVLGVPSECGERSIALVLVGAHDGAAGEPGDARVERFAYFRGRDPAHWQRDVPSFDSVRYAGVWPGVDVEYLGVEGRFRYDFHVAPHADPEAIHLRFDGAESVAVLADGSLALDTAFGRIVQPAPAIHQERGEARELVRGGYRLVDERTVGFELGAWDRERELVIDPTVVWQTLIGGADDETVTAVRVAPGGNVWLVGETYSANFPTAGLGSSFPYSDSFDAFVSEFDPTGTTLLFSALVGGDFVDTPFDAALVGDGDIVVCGSTYSDDFPALTSGATTPLQTQISGTNDAFVFRLRSSGVLEFSTYLGGALTETARAIGVLAGNDLVVAGDTVSSDFPLQNAAQATKDAGYDGFVARLSATGDALVWSTYWGTPGSDRFADLAIDAADDSVVAGGQADVGELLWAQRFLADGTPSDGLTFGNPGASTTIDSVAIAANGSVALGISTDDTGLMTLDALAGQTQGQGEREALVAVWDATLSTLEFATYLSGPSYDACVGVETFGGRLYALVATISPQLPQVDTMLDASVPPRGTYLACIDLAASPPALDWASYLPSVDLCFANSLDLDPAGGALFVAGRVSSIASEELNVFPSATFGDVLGTNDSAVLTRVDTSFASGASTVGFGPTPTLYAGASSATLTVYRTGGTSAPVTVDYSADSLGVPVSGLNGHVAFEVGEQVLRFSVNWAGLSIPSMYLTVTLHPGDGSLVDPNHASATFMVTSIPSTTSGSDDDDDCCGIATVGRGTPMSRDLDVMRAFRDRVLSRFGAGRDFTSWYYRKLSPTAVRFLREHPSSLPIARAGLWALLFAMKHPLELVGVLLVAVMVRRFRSSVRARLAVALAR